MRIDFTFVTSQHQEDLPGQKQQAKTHRAMWRSLQELIPGYVQLLAQYIDSITKQQTQAAPPPAGRDAKPRPPMPPEVSEAVVLREREAFDLGQRDRAAGIAKRTSYELLDRLTLVLPAEMLETLAPGSWERVLAAYRLGYEHQAATPEQPAENRT